MVRGLCHAPLADRDPGAGGQHDVHRADVGQFGEYPSRLVGQARAPAELSQGLAEHVGQETDEDMRAHALLIVMNNNGHGLLDALHWPEPVSGMWTNARFWGVLTMVD